MCGREEERIICIGITNMYTHTHTHTHKHTPLRPTVTHSLMRQATPHARPPPCLLRLGPRDENAAAPVVPKRVAEGLLGLTCRARLYVLSQAAGAAALDAPSSSDYELAFKN